jgi:TolB-like protein
VSDFDGESNSRKPTIFLSYASEDRQAARLIGEALPAHGLEVWFDESELGGGDVWDQKIRRQIRECDYFMALVSAQTEARHEGYFRREWRLAVERSLDMADDHLFLLPVVIDDTVESHARVPEKFLSVQWLKLPGGRPTPALEALCRRLVSGDAAAPSAGKKLPNRPIAAERPAQPRAFPREEEGQRVRFWFEVAGWAFSSAWAAFKRWPLWVRIVVIAWIGIALLDRGCSDSDQAGSAGLTSSQEQKLKAIAQQYQGGADKADLAKLAAQIAREFSDDDNASKSNRAPVLAIPFAAPEGDAAAQAIADSAFAQVYGRIAIAHHGKVALADDHLPACSLEPMLAQARKNQSAYAVCGSVDTQAPDQTLNIMIATVANGSVLWSKSYPVAGADPEKIAAEVSSKLPPLDDDEATAVKGTGHNRTVIVAPGIN